MGQKKNIYLIKLKERFGRENCEIGEICQIEFARTISLFGFFGTNDKLICFNIDLELIEAGMASEFGG